jgi:hypothetical protein
MSAAETTTALGQERLAACVFRVPINGQLQSMCAVNALGLREAYYRNSSLEEVSFMCLLTIVDCMKNWSKERPGTLHGLGFFRISIISGTTIEITDTRN